jgi:hypothetical protein
MFTDVSQMLAASVVRKIIITLLMDSVVMEQ